MKRALLVNPFIEDFAAYDLWTKPLGLLYVGGVLEKAHVAVHLIDCLNRFEKEERAGVKKATVEAFGCGKFAREEIPKPPILKAVPRRFKRYGISLERFREKLAAEKLDVVLVTSMMTYWYPGVARTIEIIKEIHKNVPVVLGGIYARLCKEHARSFSGADAVCAEWDEGAILGLIADVLGIPGRTLPEERVQPAYHLIEELPAIAVLTSRGCPFNCTYCASRILHSRFVQRAPEEFLKELKYYRSRFSVRDIAFYDDALLFDSENHIKPILRGVVKEKLDFRLHAPNGLHPRYIDPEMAKLLKESGFETIRLSLESVHADVQRASSGKVSNEEFREALKNLYAAGFGQRQVATYLLMGLPGQSVRDVIDSILFVYSLGGRTKLAEFAPIPGTPDFQKAQGATEADLTEPLYHNSSVMPLINPTFTWETVKDVRWLSNELGTSLSERPPVAREKFSPEMKEVLKKYA